MGWIGASVVRLIGVFKQRTAYEIRLSLAGSEMWIGGRCACLDGLMGGMCACVDGLMGGMCACVDGLMRSLIAF